MERLTWTLPNGNTVELLPNTGELIYEIWEEHCYSENYRINEGDTVLDIGANQGIFSLYAANRGAKVHAFEPDKTNFEILCLNIRNNILEDRIIPYPCAVGDKDGYLTLHIPDKKEGVNPSTFASTSDNWIESLSRHDLTGISEYQVKSVTLKKILKDLGTERIAVMKVDTEGAEMDILSGAEAQDFRRIDRIVMEIHDAYPEKDLYRKIINSGFKILSYNKLAGVFKTGYLYAENKSFCTGKENEKPVAILEIPDRIVQNQPVVINSGKSFSATQIDRDRLVHQLTIDGVPRETTTESQQAISFEKRGRHTVKITVWDNKSDTNPPEDLKDSAEMTIWVFAESSEETSGLESLTSTDKIHEFLLSGTNKWYIPASSFPKSWVFKSLALSIHATNIAETDPSISLAVIQNGDTVTITQNYSEIYYPGFPNNHDFVFSIESQKPTRLEIQWFVKERIGPNEIVKLSHTVKQPLFLRGENIDHICEISGEAEVILKKEILPKKWRIEYVNVGISVLAGEPTGISGFGNVCFNGVKSNLEEYFQKYRIPVDGNKQDFSFNLFIPEKRTLQFTWWPE